MFVKRRERRENWFRRIKRVMQDARAFLYPRILRSIRNWKNNRFVINYSPM